MRGREGISRQFKAFFPQLSSCVGILNDKYVDRVHAGHLPDGAPLYKVISSSSGLLGSTGLR